MKVTIVNTLENGGAANACIRLHLGLRKLGVESNLIVFTKHNKTPHSASFMDFYEENYLDEIANRSFLKKMVDKLKNTFGKTEYQRIKRQLDIRDSIEKTKAEGIEVFTFPHSPYHLHKHPLIKDADIINLHWVNNFLDYETFFANIHQPIVWTLHEMNPFTGGCSYSDDCIQYETSCKLCPQLEGSSHPQYAQTIFEIKQKALEPTNNLQVVAPSKWLRDLSKSSTIFKKFAHHHIPYSLDETIFKPQDKAKAKKELGFNPNQPLVLFVSASVDNVRKGLQYLIESIEQLEHIANKANFCAVGTKQPHPQSAHILELGPIYELNKLATVYAAADVFVIPSVADNLPNTVLESLMCGTPVIGFPAGGVPEMIEHGENGLVCDDISSSALTRALTKIITQEISFDYSQIAAKAKEKYAFTVQAKKYRKLYQEMLEN